jgi:hypothetical protein
LIEFGKTPILPNEAKLTFPCGSAYLSSICGMNKLLKVAQNGMFFQRAFLTGF